MSASVRSNPRFRPSLSFILLSALLCVLWIAGGASRGDESGQVLVRGAVWVLLIVGILLGERPSFARAQPILLLLGMMVLLALLQLMPLPPSIWQALPGRSPLSEAMAAIGQSQPWRPWSIVPGATLNALSSLIVPVATLVFVTGLKESEQRWLPGTILALLSASMLIGMLQFSGAGFDNPLINDLDGYVSGNFANRNHFALFLSFGYLIVPVWTFLEGRPASWRLPAAIGLALLFALTILASGSRAGIVVGIIALAIGLLLARQGLRRTLRRAPRWLFPVVVISVISMITLFVFISIAADRAEAINRAVMVDIGEDMRTRGLPTVMVMIRTYFPVGAGLGSFDAIFRMHEPFDLLQIPYFNQAHNDFLGVLVDTGLAGLVLMLTALGWWAYASVRVWRAPISHHITLGRAGSATLFLIFVASIVDYPGRTPLVMAMVMIAALWLSWGVHAAREQSPLPVQGHDL